MALKYVINDQLPGKDSSTNRLAATMCLLSLCLSHSKYASSGWHIQLTGIQSVPKAHPKTLYNYRISIIERFRYRITMRTPLSMNERNTPHNSKNLLGLPDVAWSLLAFFLHFSHRSSCRAADLEGLLSCVERPAWSGGRKMNTSMQR